MMNRSSRFDFSSMAIVYDRWYSSPMGGYYDAVEKREMAKRLVDGSGRRLLDIGCGTGHWSKYFAAFGFSVCGGDESIGMVRRAFPKRIPWAEFVQADARALPFCSGFFDVAVFMTSLEFMHDVEKAVEEAARCLRRPGGRILVGTLNAESRLNKYRMSGMEAPYCSAVMLSPAQMRTLLSRFGKPSVRVCAFSLIPRRPLPVLDHIYDSVAKMLRLTSGDFIVGEVQL